MITQSRLAEDLFWIRERADQMEIHLDTVRGQFALLVNELLREGGVNSYSYRLIENLSYKIPFTDAGRKELLGSVKNEGDRYWIEKEDADAQA